MSDIYSAPESEVQQSIDPNSYGSIERGLSGDYDLNIGAVMSEAWQLTKGSKTTILVALILFLVFYLAIAFAGEFLGQYLGIFGIVIVQVLVSLVVNPISVGLGIIGIKRACKVEASSTSIFDYFSKVLPVFITYLLMMLMVIIGLALLVLPGIYLSFAYMYAMTLVVEKGMSPWQALETSRKIITKKWFSFVGLLLVMGIVALIAMIPLGIGLIWVLPWSVICIGVVYRNGFGVEAETLS